MEVAAERGGRDGLSIKKSQRKTQARSGYFFLKNGMLSGFFEKFFGAEMREINDKKPSYSIFRLNQFEIRIAFFIKND